MDYEKPLLDGETRDDVEAGEPQTLDDSPVCCSRLCIVTSLTEVLVGMIAAAIPITMLLVLIAADIRLSSQYGFASHSCAAFAHINVTIPLWATERG